jgi:hypothetical protein
MRSQGRTIGLERTGRIDRRWALLAAVCLLVWSTGCLWSGAGEPLTGEPPTAPENVDWSRQELDYFCEIALGAEYGSSAAEVRKWVQDPRIKIYGSPTETDRETVQQVIDEVNGLQSQIVLREVSWRPNVEIYFEPESAFSRIEPNYRPTNYGFFWTWWKDTREVYKARLLIATEDVNQRERAHLIREELTQCLGLMRDSSRYPKSIFYTEWTDVTEYAPIDRAIIRILYSDAVQPGMTEDQVLDVLKGH